VKQQMHRFEVWLMVSVMAVAFDGRVWAADEPSAEPAANAPEVSTTASSSEEAAPDSPTVAAETEEPVAAAGEEAAESSTIGAPAASEAPASESASTPAALPGVISVDFKDADIRQVLRILSLKSGVDIVAGANVEGLVTIKLTNVPWEQALDIILRTYGFTYERKEDIVRVMTVEALEQEALSTEVFPLDYATAKEVPDVIKEMLSDRGKVKFDERTNTIIVTDIPSNLFQIKKVIERLDQRTPQVIIATKIVETKLDKGESLGIDWNDEIALTQSISDISSTFPFKGGASLGSVGELFGTQRAAERPGSRIGLSTFTAGGVTATLNFLSRRSDTHIVSNPNLAVLNNQEANIHIGEEYPIPNYTIDPTTGRTTISGYTAKKIGTVLKVTPHVNPSGEIVTDLKPEVITSADPVSFSTGANSTIELPRFTIQTAETHVRIKSGETIVIGGLVKATEVQRIDKVPVLGDIPLIGLLFRNTARNQGITGVADPVRQDLLIFLTVKLQDDDRADGTAVAVAPASTQPASH